ncbi:stage V sporulation protein AE [Salipaludibacillus sp. HK11]|uniref:stage V sporulation protein AE n=1 Tax=Salipaludibacillus sp. HK11 TaxID=3394320 RepID=UPI0039FDD04D
MTRLKKVIFITDGDESAVNAASVAANSLQCYFLSLSKGNPSIIQTDVLIRKILEAPIEPVIVLFDDAGYPGIGPGESRMRGVANSPFIQVLGVIAVAAHTDTDDWSKVDVCVDRYGNITEYGVDKAGIKETEIKRIRGDTVDLLNVNEDPIIIGVGDVGKMGGYDDFEKGAPVTKKAIQLILERSGLSDPPR